MQKYRQPFYGAYLIYDKESNNLVYKKIFQTTTRRVSVWLWGLRLRLHYNKVKVLP